MAVTLIKPAELIDQDADWTGNWRADDVWRILNAARDGDAAQLSAMLAADPTLVRAGVLVRAAAAFRRPRRAPRCGEGARRSRRRLDAPVAVRRARTLLQTATDRDRDDVAAYLRGELERRAASDGAAHGDPPRRVRRELQAGGGTAYRRSRVEQPRRRARATPAASGGRHGQPGNGSTCCCARGADVDGVGFSAEYRLGGSGFRPITLALWHTPYWRQRNDYGRVEQLLSHGADYTITIAAAVGDEGRVRELLAS